MRRTICRPLMPTMKSYQGSMAMSWFLFRRTWKPDADCPLREDGEGPSESRRDMKRLMAPNIVAISEDVNNCTNSRIESVLEALVLAEA